MNRIRLLTLAIVFLMVAILSTGAAIQDYFVGDLFLAKTIQSVTLGFGYWEQTMEVVTFIGQNSVLIATALSLSAWFLWKKRRPEALVVLAALAGLAINPLLKLVVNRPRPPDDLVVVWRDFDGLGFPSGHAFGATVVFGLLYYLAPYVVPGKAGINLIRLSSLLLILLIGVSRVFLGAHWPSDVLGGFLYGSIILTFLISLHGRLSVTYGRSTEARL